MMCYKDMTFCCAECSNNTCHRKLTTEVREAAEQWWGKEGAPIAQADFSEVCPAFVPALEDFDE